jgi:ankyrin repeat protein
LDETYIRVLKEIKKPNRDHALRVLQCLVVAIRPLRVDELAEVLAVNFDDEEGMPKLNPNWRWDDQEQALLSSCSSLIAIVESDDSRIVQFSHFSVKEFLTADRLASSSGDISRYHIDLVPAHTILAQACLSVLLRSDNRVEETGVGNSSPLARYAAEHWVAHAQDEKVSSCLRKAMEYLFDVDKPYFAAWLKLHDLDISFPSGSTFYLFDYARKPNRSATPLYYAARYGFQDLVEHLIANDPKQVTAEGGRYLTPFVAALGAGHFLTAKSLYDNGAHPNVKGYYGNTPLHSAADYGYSGMVQVLLKYKADVHARNDPGCTPLHLIGMSSDQGPNNNPISLCNTARLLLEHGADVNARDNERITVLHEAAQREMVEVVHVLLEHGADVNAQDDTRSTPLHLAARHGRVEVVRMLLEHGADVGAEDEDGRTALQVASDVGAEDKDEDEGGRTDEIVKLLSEHGAR